MAIPSQQLEAWSNSGATALSANAYTRIQTALAAPGLPLSNVGTRIFLQGSYANDTHTRGDSDIDVVVLHDGVYHYDTSALPADQLSAFQTNFVLATYQWSDFKRDVVQALNLHFGTAAVTVGNKAIKVQTTAGRMTADVVPVFLHHRYVSYSSPLANSAHRGVQFFDNLSGPIINFPEQHIERGQAKNEAARTRGNYKPTVRLFKNFRTWLVENGRLAEGVAPSYYIECALYNVPDATFIGNFSNTVPAILNHLWNVPYVNLWSQNGLIPLIGPDPTQWSADNFRAFVAAALVAWNNW